MSKQSKKEKAAEIQESIRQILFYDWDLIGINDFGPDDEYDSYVGSIYRPRKMKSLTIAAVLIFICGS